MQPTLFDLTLTSLISILPRFSTCDHDLLAGLLQTHGRASTTLGWEKKKSLHTLKRARQKARISSNFPDRQVPTIVVDPTQHRGTHPAPCNWETCFQLVNLDPNIATTTWYFCFFFFFVVFFPRFGCDFIPSKRGNDVSNILMNWIKECWINHFFSTFQVWNEIHRLAERPTWSQLRSGYPVYLPGMVRVAIMSVDRMTGRGEG